MRPVVLPDGDHEPGRGHLPGGRHGVGVPEQLDLFTSNYYAGTDAPATGQRRIEASPAPAYADDNTGDATADATIDAATDATTKDQSRAPLVAAAERPRQFQRDQLEIQRVSRELVILHGEVGEPHSTRGAVATGHSHANPRRKHLPPNNDLGAYKEEKAQEDAHG